MSDLRLEQATTPPPKRVRLSRACNRCRARKVRCDEAQPSCHRCVADGVDCITTNPRKPGESSAAFRRQAGSLAPVSAPSLRLQSEVAIGRPQVGGHAVVLPDSVGRHLPSSNKSPVLTRASIEAVRGNPDPSATAGDIDSIQSLEYALNTVSVSERKYLGPTSLQVFTHWLELTFHTPTTQLTDCFELGMRYCEEMELPEYATPYPSMPACCSEYIARFFKTAGLIFPMLDRTSMEKSLTQIHATGPAQIERRQRPALAIMYACVAIGADACGDYIEGTRLLSAAYALYPVLVALPYLKSAQAFILMALALRGRNKDGAAAQVLGQAIRILHSIGLHKKLKDSTDTPLNVMDSIRNTWWTAYCLESIMCFEAGRPSHINDLEVDQELPDVTDNSDHTPLHVLVDLARIQNMIKARLFARNTHRGPGEDLPQSLDILLVQADCDTALQGYYVRLRECLHIDDFSFDNGLPPHHAFILIQYFATSATVHRAALLSDHRVHLAAVERVTLPPTSAARLRSSETICATAARKIATIFLQTCELTGHSRWTTMTGPLMAVYILAIYTLKHPSSWSARSDLSLLQSVAEVVEQTYREDGQDPGFYTMLTVLRHFASQGRLKPLDSDKGLSRRGSVGTGDHTAREAIPDSLINPHANGSSLIESQSHMTTFDAQDEWNALFPHLYLGDMSMDPIGSGDLEQLMGIPQFSDEDLFNFMQP